jgi:hypothetical protein
MVRPDRMRMPDVSHHRQLDDGRPRIELSHELPEVHVAVLPKMIRSATANVIPDWLIVPPDERLLG